MRRRITTTPQQFQFHNLLFPCTAFEDWAVHAVSGAGILHSDIMMIGMLVWMNCTLSPYIRGDIMLEKI